MNPTNPSSVDATPEQVAPHSVPSAIVRDACDMLAERTYGNPARSPAHNARVILESALRATGGAWRSLSGDTDWIDGRDVVLLAHDMEVQARYCPGEWSDDTPISPAEYDGAVWSCFDDKFQIEIEETSRDPGEWCHNGATHWRPLTDRPAQAIEARRAETQGGSVHESAVRQDAPETRQEPHP